MLPDELADQARVDEQIASWNAEQILDYENQERRLHDGGNSVPERVKESLRQLDFGELMSRRFPVGMFFDSIKEDYDGGRRPSCTQLMQVAETGKELFYAAIGHIDANEEFLEDARSYWGPLVDAALAEMDGSIERRDRVTGEFTVHVWPPKAIRRSHGDRAIGDELG